MLRTIGIAICLPWLIDAGVRLILARCSRAWSPPCTEGPPAEIRWLVVVPARAEGRAVEPTLASIDQAAQGHHVASVLLLDGPDDAAVEAARETAATPIVKMPAGPTKGAALRWLVESHGELLDDVDAVLILDVGSRVGEDFFDHIGGIPGADAVQAQLRGTGGGVGEAASLSENAAQRWQDRGRQVLGWAVQLRGTGTAYTPKALRATAPQLRTMVEDTEATVLLASEGATIVLGGEKAVVEDVKPLSIEDAARQRSRWLLGQYGVFVRQPRAILRLLARRPLEGLGSLAGLLSRPLSLTALFRLALGLLFLLDSLKGSGGVLSLVMGVLLITSLAGDLVLLRSATDAPLSGILGGGIRMLVSWCAAILLLPRAILGWMRGRRG